MIIPPLKHRDGTTTEPKRLDGFMLPVIWDLQRLCPKPPPDVTAEQFGPRGLPAYGRHADIGRFVQHIINKTLCIRRHVVLFGD